MGGHMSIINETNDCYSYCVQYRPDWEGILSSGVIQPYGGTCEVSQREILSTVYIKYGKHNAVTCRSSLDLQRDYNGINRPIFTIQPFGNMIQLCCNKGGNEPMCRNQGEIPSALGRHHGSVGSRWPQMPVCCGCDGQHVCYHPKESDAKKELNGSLEKDVNNQQQGRMSVRCVICIVFICLIFCLLKRPELSPFISIAKKKPTVDDALVYTHVRRIVGTPVDQSVKQFGPRSVPTFCRPDLGPNCLQRLSAEDPSTVGKELIIESATTTIKAVQVSLSS